MRISTSSCAAGIVLPLAVAPLAGMPAHVCTQRPLPAMPVGTRLRTAQGQDIFVVTGRVLLPLAQGPHALACPLLTALMPVTAASLEVTTHRQGRAVAYITLSDKGAAGQREDSSGPAIADMLGQALPLCHCQGFLLPDDAPLLRTLLTELALGQGYHLICTTGGTGLGPRDVSPEATMAVLEKRLPGFEQAMMAASLAKTPHACISRAVAGVLGQCLCLNLPGSRKAVLENLAAVLPALPHALDKLLGDDSDCGLSA